MVNRNAFCTKQMAYIVSIVCFYEIESSEKKTVAYTFNAYACKSLKKCMLYVMC